VTHPAELTLLAVDIGGTKTAAAWMTVSGEILRRAEEPTNQSGPQAGLEQIERMLRSLLPDGQPAPEQVLGVGIGIPAVLELETDRVIWAPNIHGWRDVDLRFTLQRQLGLPVYVEYDGHTAVMGEFWQGAGQGYRSVALLIIGTGIGGGLILDGRLFRGRDRLAGAAGWFALTTQPDQDDRQGQSIGQWESLGAGPGIALRALQALPDHPESSLYACIQQGSLTAREVFEAARRGDALALQVVDETAGILGLGAANVVSLVNPEIVILGGSVGRQTDLLLPRIREVVLRWAQPASARSVQIVPAGLGGDAGLYGAAYAVLERSGKLEVQRKDDY
jgi:glucokinase